MISSLTHALFGNMFLNFLICKHFGGEFKIWDGYHREITVKMTTLNIMAQGNHIRVCHQCLHSCLISDFFSLDLLNYSIFIQSVLLLLMLSRVSFCFIQQTALTETSCTQNTLFCHSLLPYSNIAKYSRSNLTHTSFKKCPYPLNSTK